MTDLPRLLAGLRADGLPLSLDEHRRTHGGLPGGPAQGAGLVELVAASGLRGRGGAGFPTATKLEAVRAGRGRPIVVANGAEGEPPSGKDKALLAYVPHLVLDGAVLAARAVGAREVVVAVGPVVHQRVAAAVAERRAGGGDGRVALRVVVVPERFVAGEETALVQFVDGGPCLPTFTPPRPFERGVRGAPTLVQNVETLAHLALIARHGPAWFRAAGTRDEPGSALVTLSGAVRRPGVYEIALGSALDELLDEAGGLAADVQAFLVGGYFGSWIDAAAADGARLADAALAGLGASLGARAIVALPASSCGLVETARVARYLADESAGQCGPCVHGLAAIADGLAQLVAGGRAAADRSLLRRRLDQVAGRGACRHPDGAARLVSSALTVFGYELERHVHGRTCRGRGAAVLPLPARRRGHAA